MKRHATTQNSTDLQTIADDAKALLSATAGIAEEKVVEARQKLTAALERCTEAWDNAKERAVAGAKATDEYVHEHPYQAIGVAFLAGAAFTWLMSRRN